MVSAGVSNFVFCYTEALTGAAGPRICCRISVSSEAGVSSTFVYVAFVGVGMITVRETYVLALVKDEVTAFQPRTP
jgi:hypothetical protein